MKSGVFVFLFASSAFAREIYTDTTDVHACVQSGKTTIAATGGGVVIQENGSTKTITSLDGLPDTRAWSLARVGASTYVGTDRGLAELDASYGVKRTALDVSVRALEVEGENLLLGTFGRGLVRVNAASLSASFVSLSDPRVLSITSDRIGTMTGQFSRSTLVRVSSDPLLPKSASCSVPSSGLPSNDISAIASNDRGMWIGTFDKGLALLSNGSIKTIDGVDKRIDALAADKKSDRMWIGTARGLYSVDASGAHFLDAGTDEVHALAALEGGGVIAGTGRGAIVVKETITRIGSKEGVDLPSVTAVLENKGVLYLGTTGGLYVGSGKSFQRLSVASGHLPDDWVTALAANGDVIYAGTYNSGVVRLKKETTWSSEKLGGGFVNPTGIAMKDGTLAIATMDGLLVGSSLAKKATLGRDVTGIVFRNDGAWIATRRGLQHETSL